MDKSTFSPLFDIKEIYVCIQDFFGIKMVGGEMGKTWVEKFGVWLSLMFGLLNVSSPG